MKALRWILSLAMIVLITGFIKGQDSEIARMKASRTAPPPVEENIMPSVIPEIREFDGGRNGGFFIELDGSFSVVPFPNDIWDPPVPPDYRNDDGYYGPLPLGFTFCFYETEYTEIYINNNGNISFVNPYITYNPVGFPSTQYIMIAPFWGDVDTRDPNSGIVYYKLDPGRLTVIWQEVGYFDQWSDLVNTFQVVITDGSDPLIGVGNNVGFAYKDMQWTTGDASDGVGGFGGFPATVGVNKGDGVNFAQVGRFNQPGTCYDGPYGANDCVSYLDFRSYVFNACGEEIIIVGEEIPISNWAVFIGIFLIFFFIIIRFRKLT